MRSILIAPGPCPVRVVEDEDGNCQVLGMLQVFFEYAAAKDALAGLDQVAVEGPERYAHLTVEHGERLREFRFPGPESSPSFCVLWFRHGVGIVCLRAYTAEGDESSEADVVEAEELMTRYLLFTHSPGGEGVH